MDTLHRTGVVALGLALASALSGCRDRSDGPATAGASPEISRGDGALRPPFAEVAKTNPIDFSPRPSLILFVVIDTLRADHLGCYGDDRGLTPVIDRFAEASVVFENAVATSSWTKSSVASMFTSRYPGSLQVLGRGDLLTEDNLTLAELLDTAGGYDCLGIYANGNVSTKFGFRQGFQKYTMPPHASRTGYANDFLVHDAEAVTNHALETYETWLERRPRPDAPVFLFVHYVDPHDPYLPHPELMDRPEPPGRFDGSRTQLRDMDALEPSAEDIARIRWLYEGEVKYCDMWIGRLIQGIQRIRKGSLDDVMFVLTADHGEGLWDHAFRAHGRDLYEEQTHVPLIVRYAGQREGRRIQTPISLVDVAPSIAEAARIPKPSDWQGFDLRPVIEGEERARGFDYVYSELRLQSHDFEALRTADQKVIRNRSMKFNDKAAYERYDLRADPGEKENLFGGRDSKLDVHFRDTLASYSQAVVDAAHGGGKVDYADLDLATLESLRALGYIGDDELEDAKKRRAQRMRDGDSGRNGK